MLTCPVTRKDGSFEMLTSCELRLIVVSQLACHVTFPSHHALALFLTACVLFHLLVASRACFDIFVTFCSFNARAGIIV